MKYLLSIFFICNGLSILAQVGINTSNPVDRGLHVAGATENVRVEGLNAENNSNNLGPGATTRVYVDADGDLVLGSENEVNLAILVDSDNYLNNVENPTSLIVQTGNNFGYNPAGVPTEGIVGASFTLTENAILEINYSVTWAIYDAISLDKKRISDLRARVIQTGIYFIDTATEVPITHDVDGNLINGMNWCIDTNSAGTGCLQYGGLLALAGQFYNNGSLVRGAYANFRNSASDYVKLGPGTYTALFAARLQVEATGGEGAAKMYLGSGYDKLQIVAYYYE